MREAPFTPNEASRQVALRSYHILDTVPEEDYDEIVRLASKVCGVPMSLVSLVDQNRQWFKAKVGLDARETPRKLAFCAHAILNPNETLVVEDALKDERFAENPLVTNDPKIRFYAGSPLVTSKGHTLGTLCVIDRKPRQLDTQQIDVLNALAKNVVNLIEKHRASVEAKKRKRCLGLMEDVSAVGYWEIDMSDNNLQWSDGLFRIYGLGPDVFQPSKQSMMGFYHPEDLPRVEQVLDEAVDKKQSFSFDARIIKLDGEVKKVRSKGDCDVDEAGNLRAVFGVFSEK